MCSYNYSLFENFYCLYVPLFESSSGSCIILNDIVLVAASLIHVIIWSRCELTNLSVPLQVIEESARFDILLKVSRGDKEEKLKVEVHKSDEGAFKLNHMAPHNE